MTSPGCLVDGPRRASSSIYQPSGRIKDGKLYLPLNPDTLVGNAGEAALLSGNIILNHQYVLNTNC